MSGASPADRQKMRELLEERKRKLEELKQKNSASPGGVQAQVSTPDKTIPTAASASSVAAGGGGTPTPSALRSTSSPSPATLLNVPGTPASIMSPGGAGGVLGMVNAMLQSSSTSTTSSTTIAAPPSSSSTSSALGHSHHHHMSRLYRSELSMSLSVASLDVQPKEIPMHSRGAQTDPSLLQPLLDQHIAASAAAATATSTASASASKSSPSASTGHDDAVADDSDDIDTSDATSTATGQSSSSSASLEAHERELLRRHSVLPAHEKDPLLSSSSFVGFLKRSSPVVEQAMYLQDRFTVRAPSLAADHPQHDPSKLSSSLHKGHRRNAASTSNNSSQNGALDLLITLNDEQFTKDQDIYDVQWNPSDPSRILSSSYSNATGSSVLEWNLEYEGRVESRHHCQSRITSLRYWNGLEPQRTITPDSRADTNQRLIIGGSYTGQIVLWDMKASSFRPIVTLSHSSISSSSSSSGASPHQHPIYNIVPIDSHLFATADTMGLMAIWDMNKLQQPVEVISLSWTAGASTPDPALAAPSAAQQEVAVTSLCFRDDNTFFATGEDGTLYQGQRHGDFRGLTKSLNKGHEATITSADLHPSPSPTRIAGRSVPVSNNLSDLMLTSSVDWSVALWSPRSQATPLHRFSYFNDYVLDVAWSPAHPAMFAAADGSGCLSVWNLNQDTEVPAFVNKSVSAAINRLCWNPHITPNGLMLAGAEHHSNIHIFDVPSDISIPSPEAWTQFDEVISRLVQGNNNVVEPLSAEN